MEVVEEKPSSGYGKPPWIFRGSALYQLHLVKAEKVQACIPKEFKLVQAFGYTLGGFFLASYEDSPVGVFDELVVIAGLVWNRPTSCAWETKVYVNSNEACNHGRKEVGLPSQMARFSKKIEAISRQPKGRMSGFCNMIGMNDIFCNQNKDHLNVQVTKVKCLDQPDSCNISLTSAVPALRWMGPAIRMSLPSFRVQAVQPMKVSGAKPLTNGDKDQCSEDDRQNLITYVMLSKPILALKFNQMRMQVEAPILLSQCSNSSETSASSVPLSNIERFV